MVSLLGPFCPINLVIPMGGHVIDLPNGKPEATPSLPVSKPGLRGVVRSLAARAQPVLNRVIIGLGAMQQ